MRACTMANGAVFFIPDEIERKTKAISYADLLAESVASEEVSRPKKMTLLDRLMKRDRNAQDSQAKAA